MTALCTARKRRKARPRGVIGGFTALACLLAACAPEPRPRSFQDFMEDRIARDGVLARCAADEGGAPRNEVECANARRAAATIALRKERARREELERESRRKIEALRARIAHRDATAREAELSYDEHSQDGVPGTAPTAEVARGGQEPGPGGAGAELPDADQPQAAARGSAADPQAGTVAADDRSGAARTAAEPHDALQEIVVPARRRLPIAGN